MTDPATRTYAETWAGRGVPMDELGAFVARAVAAGAPLTARIRLEDADRNVLLGLTIPGTRMSVTWSYGQSITPAGSNVAYSGPGAHPGSYDDPWPFKPGDILDAADGPWLDVAPEGTIVAGVDGHEWTNDGTRAGDELPTWVSGRDRTPYGVIARIASRHLAARGPLTVVSLGEAHHPPAEPWPFKPGDVVDDVEGAVTEWLDAAPVGTVVADHAGDEWKHEGLEPEPEYEPRKVYEHPNGDRLWSVNSERGVQFVNEYGEKFPPGNLTFPVRPLVVIDPAAVDVDALIRAVEDSPRAQGWRSRVGTYRITSPDVAARGPLTVVRVGETGE